MIALKKNIDNLNKICDKCNKECYLFDFNKMNYFCDICSSDNLLLNCKIIDDFKDCSKIFENYIWVKEIPKKGAFGFLYIIYNKILNKNTYLKVQDYLTRFLEMYISCLVSVYPNFVKTYNTWVCNEEPVAEIWKKSKFGSEKIDPEYPRKLCYIEMKIYNGSFSDIFKQGTHIQFTYHDKVSICFELFNSMKKANDELGFVHGDIHFGNIFYEFVNITRNYYIETKNKDNKRKTLNINCRSNFYPVWGDFGKSYVLKGKYRDFEHDIEEEDEEYRKIIFRLMDEFSIYDDVDKLGKELYLKKNKKTNQQILEWLGNLVIESESESEKKQRLKNQIQ